MIEMCMASPGTIGVWRKSTVIALVTSLFCVGLYYLLALDLPFHLHNRFMQRASQTLHGLAAL